MLNAPRDNFLPEKNIFAQPLWPDRHWARKNIAVRQFQLLIIQSTCPVIGWLVLNSFCREEAIHHNISFNHDEGTVSSSPRYTLQWASELNTGQENDTLVLPHLAMLVIEMIILFTTLKHNRFNSPKGSLINYLFWYEDYRLIPLCDKLLLGNGYKRVFFLYEGYKICMAYQTNEILIVYRCSWPTYNFLVTSI